MNEHEVTLDWEPHHTTIWWNERCAQVLEVFGLPGDRYVYTPSADFMTFKFKDKRDAFLCKIMFSEDI